jgi:hypothetical protein
MSNIVSAAELRARAREAAAEASRLTREADAATAAERAASRPQMPPVGGTGDRAIVCFTRYQSGREYNYAALGWQLGRSVRWAVTGRRRRFNWAGLLDFIGEANWGSLHLMHEARLLGPLPGAEPAVAERMGSFGKVLATEPVGEAVQPYADGGYLS